IGNKVVGTGWGLWGSATSLQTYTGTAVVSGRRLHPANGYSFLGLTDAALSANAPYYQYDYSFYFYEDSIQIWENGSQIAVPVASGATDSHFCEIEYDGSNVTYRINGAVVRQVATTSGRAFQAAVSTCHTDRGVQDIVFKESPLRFATSGSPPTIIDDRILGSVDNVWGSAISLNSSTGTAIVSGRRDSAGQGYAFLGLTDGPLSTSLPYDYDYSFYFQEGQIRIWENGSQVSVPVAGGVDNPFCEIVYDGSKVIYRIDGAVVREVATTSGRTFQAGVTIYYTGHGVQDIGFTGQLPETTRYAYDARNHLRYEIGAEGKVIEYRYDGFGQQVAQLVYTESFYDVAPLAASQALTEATLNSWVSALPDKSSVERTNTYYDVRGQVSSVVSYSSLTKFGEGTESPLAIAPGVNTTVAQQADGLYRITKTAGGITSWDADAHSLVKADGDFLLRLRPGQNNKYVVGGMSTVPGGSASYTNPEYGLYFLDNGQVYYMEKGVYATLGVTYNAGDDFWISRTGSTITYYKGATVLRTRTAATETLYFDSSFYTPGATLDVGFTPQGVTNGVNTTVTQLPDGLYSVTKTGGNNSVWDADAYSTAKADGDFVLRLRPGQNDKHMMGGVSSSPGTSAHYNNLEHAFYFVGNAVWYQEPGAIANLGITYNPGDNFWLVRTGTTINYYKGATLEAAVAAGSLHSYTGATGIFYFDSALLRAGATMDVAFTPATISGVNTSVTPLGDGLHRITKTSGGGANWDADARSSAKADGDFVLRLRPGQNNLYVIGGVATAPTASASYEQVLHGFYFQPDGTFHWFQYGYSGLLGTYNSGDNFWLVRTGSTINYYKGATLEAAVAAGTLRTRTGASGTFYFDSTFHATGAAMDVAFMPDLAATGPSAAFSRSSFIYDQAGHLLSRMTDGQLAETFVRDGLGRIVASTDRNGGT
ncbi:MAG: hypothetical protein JW741_05515, partial [Sedimentisphaerales bacterium]|nr:hypothetical protein [Sedimentisphaerales bacterium]